MEIHVKSDDYNKLWPDSETDRAAFNQWLIRTFVFGTDQIPLFVSLH